MRRVRQVHKWAGSRHARPSCSMTSPHKLVYGLHTVCSLIAGKSGILRGALAYQFWLAPSCEDICMPGKGIRMAPLGGLLSLSKDDFPSYFLVSVVSVAVVVPHHWYLDFAYALRVGRSLRLAEHRAGCERRRRSIGEVCCCCCCRWCWCWWWW